MTPDPLPVALPELPTVAWLVEFGAVSLPKGHQSRITAFEAHHSEADALNSAHCLEYDSLVFDLVRKSDAEAALRAQAEEVAALRADAERLDRLNELLHWDGHGYWLSDICIRERELGQDSCPPPTPQEFREELDAYLAASKQEKPHG